MPRRPKRASRARFPGFQYSRFANPTVRMFETRMADFEGAEDGRATATGMAAVTLALMGQVKAGDHIVSSRALFGSCLYVVEELLPRFGVASTLVDGTDLDQWKNAVRPNTKTFFMETPANPTLEVIDIAAVAKIAHDAGATVTVDNVFSTPLWQSPLELGADCVVYSTTKHIDGQGRCLGGIVLGSSKFIQDNIHNLHRQTGPSMSPFNAWVMLKGLETLAVRVRQQTQTRRLYRRQARRPSEAVAADLSRPRRPSAGRRHQAADEGRLEPDRLRGQGRQDGRLRGSGRAAARAHLQQSRRRQEPDHPSGDHDASAHHARRRAPISASATGSCGCRSGWNIRTTFWRTCWRRSRRPETKRGTCERDGRGALQRRNEIRREYPHPLFGFLCAGCGRCLEEMPAWQLGKDRFYCGIFCREADEAALRPNSAPQAARRPDRTISPGYRI